MMELKYHFASDNCSGVCPEAWETLSQANHDSAAAYGDDCWTHRATDLIRDLFETQCEVFFTFSGTAANSLALAHLCQSYHSVICHERSHVETDECGGPEFFSNGTKLLLVPGEAGKIVPADVEATVKRRSDIHYPKPNVLTVTQATELGTVYSAGELSGLSETTRRLKLKLHMDGARFANAVATLNCSPKEITWQAGVDVLCFGGAKNGLPIGEAVVFFKKEMAYEFDYRCKQAGQLGSKMRYMSAPWVGLLESGAWLRNAQNANQCARLLESELRSIPSINLLSQVEANSVFVELPASVSERLRNNGWRFYNFIGAGGARFMCSWATTAEQVHALASDIREAVRG